MVPLLLFLPAAPVPAGTAPAKAPAKASAETPPQKPAPAPLPAFDELKLRLIADGFPRERIEALYTHPDTRFDAKGVSLFFVHNESKLNYNQFSSKKSIASARKYMAAHDKELSAAQKRYGVDKTIITAIILVETRLGTYLGKRSTLSTLSTIAALKTPQVREHLWNGIASSKRFTREKFDSRADKKSSWAYDELKAFLTFTAKEEVDPTGIRGSYAGALGIPQFMPSNLLTLARDGNGDGRINLFTHADAITSIANFLRHHGWKPGIPRQDARKVLFRYNHSNYYVDTLLKISDLLKG